MSASSSNPWNPSQATVFISYSRQNRDFAKDLYQRLGEQGFTLWRDVHDIAAGADDWWEAIKQGIEACDTLILCMSMPALKSPIVSDEWFYARQLGKRVIPVVADDIWEHSEVLSGSFTIPNWMNRRNWIDYRDGRPEADAAWQNLLHTLRTPYLAKRFINMVEELPPRFVRRPHDIDRAIRSLVDDKNDVIAMTTALRGAGGYGKTTLAKAVARDVRVQGAFDDGILWVTLGEELLKKQGDALRTTLIGMTQELIFALTEQRPVIETLEMANTKLREAIGDLYILLVIDDVWDEMHLKPFLVNGPHSACLITTRNVDALGRSAMVKHDVDKMRPAEAVELLGAGFAPEEAKLLKAEFAAFARDLREYPLLLALANSAIANWKDDLNISLGEALALARETFAEQGIHGFDDEDSQDRSRAVDRTLAVSLNHLKPEEKRRYEELAIFREDASIPLTTLERYWGMSKVQTLQFCSKLYRKTALLQSMEGGAIRIHDAFREYLIRQQSPDQQHILHARLIDGYGDLTALPDEYAWRNIAYHLTEAGRSDRLRELLLDYVFLQAKLDATDVNALIADCGYLTGNEAIRLLKSALSMSAHVLNQDKAQWGSQLVGRLMTWRRAVPEIHTLTEAIIADVQGLYPAFPDSDYTPLHLAGGALVRTLIGHRSNVNHVTLSSDGMIAVSASDDNTLIIWDLASGQPRHFLTGHTDSVRHVALTPDGATAVSASLDNTLIVWDLALGQQRLCLKGHTAAVTHIAVTPDGTTAVSSSDDNRLIIWDIASGQQRHVLKGHVGGVLHVAVTMNGATAVSASEDKTLIVWDLSSGQQRHVLTGHTAPVKYVALTLDGTTAVSASEDKTLIVWDLSTGQQRHRLTKHTNSVLHVTLTPDGATAVSASGEKTLIVWDITSGQLRHVLEGHTSAVIHVALTPNGTTAISASWDKTLIVWDLASGQQRHILEGHSGGVQHVALTADGATVVSTALDDTLIIWDLAFPQLRQVLTGHTSMVTHVAVTRNGATAVSSSRDKTLVWNLTSGQLRYVLGHTPAVRSVALTAEGATAVCVLREKTLLVWDLASGQQRHILKGHRSLVKHVALTSDASTAVSASLDTTLIVWDLASGQQRHILIGHTKTVNYVALSLDGATVISASSDNTLIIWDLISGQPRHHLTGHTAPVKHVVLTPDATIAVSASVDNTLIVWDLTSGHQRHVLKGHTDEVIHVTLTPDGASAVSTSHDNTLIVWDVESGEKRMQVSDTAEGQLALTRAYPSFTDFHRLTRGLDGLRLVYGGMTLTLRTPDDTIARFTADGDILTVAAAPGGIVVAGDFVGRVLFLRFSAGREH